MESQSDSTSRVILVIVGILVLSALGYFATKYFSEKESSAEKGTTIEALNTEIKDLEAKILGFEMTIADQETSLIDKSNQLNKKVDELSQLILVIEAARKENKANLAKLREYEQRIADLKVILDSYRREINWLKDQNLVLSGKVDSLRISEARLRHDNQDLIRQNLTTTQTLSETRQIASVLKTKDFRYFNIKKGGKERQETEFRRGSLNELKICFTIIENLVAQPGQREVYLVYENPDGTVQANEPAGISGTFTFDHRERPYSVKTTVDYNRLAQEICVIYTPISSESYQKGPQYISVYCDGRLIGQSSFMIR
ncbi:MAG: hypothetical protein SF053_12375 [Bacteroidia bacterium]|nr:hypothetical protein [Bacteroidia bacterium]